MSQISVCGSVALIMATHIFPSALVSRREEPIVKCESYPQMKGRLSYKIGLTFRTRPEPGSGPSIAVVQTYLSVEHINATDLVKLASQFNRDFCREDYLMVMIFTDKRYIYAISVPGLRGYEDSSNANRGFYSLNRKTGEEYVSFSRVPNYDKNPQTRTRIDLKN